MKKYHVMKFQAPFERVKYYSDYPEIMLYRAIILQAIIDATNTSDAKIPKILEKEAKNWIFNSNEDFDIICENANINPEYVRKISSKTIELNLDKSNF
ncbi:MAG: hypothetical protein ISN64_03025 [Rickettsia sp.]|nr:hypothetical protein [Rickettsia sp.]